MKVLTALITILDMPYPCPVVHAVAGKIFTLIMYRFAARKIETPDDICLSSIIQILLAANSYDYWNTDMQYEQQPKKKKTDPAVSIKSCLLLLHICYNLVIPYVTIKGYNTPLRHSLNYLKGSGQKFWNPPWHGYLLYP